MAQTTPAHHQQLLDFITYEVDLFIKQHPHLRFYTFALDCNAEYASVALSFNTLEAFELTLQDYRSGRHAARYNNPNAVKELKYNPGDWEYNCVATLDIAPEEELAQLYGEDIEQQIDEIMALCQATLAQFKATATYASIPKTDDFVAFCIDHDQDILDVIP